MFKPKLLKTLVFVILFIAVIAYLVPVKSFSHQSCGLEDVVERFDLIKGEYNDYLDSKKLIEGVPLCATEASSQYTYRLYLL